MPGSDVPVITVEDPREVITAHDPLRSQVVRAGMKTLHDPYEGVDSCYIYLPPDPKLYDPERVTVYRAWRQARNGTRWTSDYRFDGRQGWQWDEPETLDVARIPIVRFRNRGGVAEFEPHLSILGRINRITLQRMLIGEIQAFRQRAVEGLPRFYPEDFPVPEMRGKEIDYEGVFEPGPGSMWMVPPGAKFWESQPIDLRPLLDEERMEYRTASALMGIPVSYFNPDDTNGSAEGASLQRETLVYRAEDRKVITEAGLNMTMSHVFEAMGDRTRMPVGEIETIWAPIERLSLTERYNAAVQGRAAGLATDTVRRMTLKMTPREMKQAALDDARDMVLGIGNQGPTPMEAISMNAQRETLRVSSTRVPRETADNQPAPPRAAAN